MTDSNDAAAVSVLSAYLQNIPSGSVQESAKSETVKLLAQCWHALTGSDDGGMEGHKLIGRTENITWTSPVLQFRIERHGATVNGSKLASVQHWSVNLDKRDADLQEESTRRLEIFDARLDVNKLASEICNAITAKVDEPRLKWDGNDTVKVLIAVVIPPTNKQTTAGRRKRFWKALDEKLAPLGWKRSSPQSQTLLRQI
jgi:hypothetical protein